MKCKIIRDVLALISNLIYSDLDNSNSIAAVSLDFLKAFGTVKFNNFTNH